jgi:hypothetical protein
VGLFKDPEQVMREAQHQANFEADMRHRRGAPRSGERKLRVMRWCRSFSWNRLGSQPPGRRENPGRRLKSLRANFSPANTAARRTTGFAVVSAGLLRKRPH